MDVDIRPAVTAAMTVFEDMGGQPREALTAALTQFVTVLAEQGMIVAPRPPGPFSDAQGAAAWLAKASAHPRCTAESVYGSPFEVEFAAAKARLRPGIAPEDHRWIREAVKLLEAHHSGSTPGTS